MLKTKFACLLMFSMTLLSSTSVFSAEKELPDGRIDIDVKNGPADLNLSVVEASEDTKASNASKTGLNWYFPTDDRAWSQSTLKIKSNMDCKARLRLKSKFTKPEEAVWVLYDGIQVEGAELRNADLEDQPDSKRNGWIFEEQVPGLGPKFIKEEGVAKSGKGCFLVWHNGPATYNGFNLPANKVVTISVWAKKPPKDMIPGAGGAADVQTVAKFASDPISLASVANMGFKDEVTNDDAGGWTDEGPNNDISCMTPGRKVLRDVTFEILDPAANNGKGCIVMSAPNLKNGTWTQKAITHKYGGKLKTQTDNVEIPAGDKAYKFVYLLHAMGWAPDEKRTIGTITAKYADGSSTEIPVQATVDVSNWWNPQAMQNGFPAWKGRNLKAEIGLYLSKFPVDDKPLKSLKFECKDCAWMIMGVSASRDNIPMPVFAPPSFDFTQESLAKRYPAFSAAADIATAMKSEKALETKFGLLDGRPTAWLHGEWNIIPVMEKNAAVKGKEITSSKVFVPSFLGSSKGTLKKAAYAPQPESWQKATVFWYSTNVAVPQEFTGGPLVVHFDAVDFLGAVFINGEFQKIHTGRFTPFNVYLPDSIKPGDTFNLSVFCLKLAEGVLNQACPFMQGVSPDVGGITAPVYLFRDTPLKIENLRIVTSLTGKKLSVSFKCSGNVTGATVEPKVVDASGTPVALAGLATKPAAAEMSWETAWDNPHLWSDEDPYLYRLQMTVKSAEGKETVQEQTFGFREISIKGGDIVLNGSPVRLFGLSYEPQCLDAWPRTDEEFNYKYLMALKKHFGVNAVRFHHIPAWPAQLRAADRAGILAINQSGLWTGGRFANYRAGNLFIETMKKELSEWVWRDINHPSTIIWDTANEYIIGSPEWHDFWVKLDEIVKDIDKTRPVEQSGSGFEYRNPMIRHFHNRENYDQVFDFMKKKETPSIFGEFWIGSGKRILTLPRTTFTVEGFNREWVRCLEDKMTLMRVNGGAGFFPFHQIEHGLEMLGQDVPKNAKFAISSFNPVKMDDRYEINTFKPSDKQVNPIFVEACNRFYGKVAGLWFERSQVFSKKVKTERNLFLANDTRSEKKYDVSITLKIGSEEMPVAKFAETLAAGQTMTRKIEVPGAKTAGQGLLIVKISYGGEKEFVNETPAQVVDDASYGQALTVRLYKGSEALQSVLKAAGITVQAVDKLEAGTSPLLIGEDTLGFGDKSQMEALMRTGDQKILVLAQSKVSFADILGLGYVTPSPTETSSYSSAQNKKLIASGISSYDYPGGIGRSYFGTYIMPMPAEQIPPSIEKLFTGTRFEDVPCLRYEMAKGNAIFCQLQLEKHFLDDARAKKILLELARLLDEKSARNPGAVYTKSDEIKETLGTFGFKVAEKPDDAKLAVVSHKEYKADPKLQQMKDVVVYALEENGEIDGKKIATKMVRHFTTFMVSAEVPGLYEMGTANFTKIMEAGGFCKAVNPPTLPSINIPDSKIAAAGKKASMHYDIFDDDNYNPVIRYYEIDGKRRWVTGFDDTWNPTAAIGLCVAKDMGMEFRRELGALTYSIVDAREVKIDGNVEDWTYDGDINLRNWARANPLIVGNANPWGIFYMMADSANLYVAFAAPEDSLPVGNANAKLVLKMDKNELVIKRQADGALNVALDGAVLADPAKWLPVTATLVDAGARQDEMNKGFTLEISIPLAKLALQKRMAGSIELNDGKAQVTVPAAGAGSKTFKLVME
ncbi:MAG: hypothetical protein A2X48_13500 [Lentisphaerae bacterium GWF2_49_21]|nr:MAG: hypothetical protein A2X48_13500 [Lentisphaerae bacterium GWF2_49_21]